MSGAIGQLLAASEIELPTGWRRIRLGEIFAEVQAGFAAGERETNGVVQLRMNNVDVRGHFVWDRLTRIPADEAQRRFFSLRPGDILFNNTNSTDLVGKTALFEEFSEPIVFSNHFTRLRVKSKEADALFVASFINSLWCRGVFSEICNKWIGQSAVKYEKLAAIEIPLPTLAEQRRIAAVLRAKLAEVECVRAALAAQLAAAESLPAAHLRAAFDSNEAKAWPRRELAHVATLLSSTSVALAGDTQLRVITTGCLTENGFRPEGIKTSRMWSHDIEQAIARPGEILVARSNTEEMVGRASVVPKNVERAAVSDLLHRVWSNPETNAEFLGAWFSFLLVTGYWRSRAGGASSTMKKIGRTQLLRTEVPSPNLATQRRLAAELKEKLATAAELRAALEAQAADLAHLPAALLREAFAGRL